MSCMLQDLLKALCLSTHLSLQILPDPDPLFVVLQKKNIDIFLCEHWLYALDVVGFVYVAFVSRNTTFEMGHSQVSPLSTPNLLAC